MSNLVSAAKPQGFVLLHTLLKGETLGETVSFLTSMTQNSNQPGLLTQVNGLQFSKPNWTIYAPMINCVAYDQSPEKNNGNINKILIKSKQTQVWVELNHCVWKVGLFADTYLFVLQAEWEKVFSEASLTLVAVRRSFYGSALFLCRLKSQRKPSVYLPVDGTDFLWVEKLKVSFVDLLFSEFRMCPNSNNDL